MRLHDPYRCKCGECGADFLRWRARGNFSVCTPCQKAERLRKWKAANRELVNERERIRIATAKLYGCGRVDTWQKRNKEKSADKARRWRRNNPERSAQILAAYKAKHREKLLNQYRYRHNRTRVPNGIERGAIDVFYEIARRVSHCTGIRFEVDHIMPLKGRDSCGLHVPWNLRVIPKIANIKKGNRVEEVA